MKKLSLLAVAALLPVTAWAGATASNYDKNAPRDKGDNYYNAQSAIDGKIETAWVLPGESAQLGESLTIDVPKGTVDKIGLVVGWAENPERFTDHPRVKKVMVEGLCCMGDEKVKSTGTAHAVFEGIDLEGEGKDELVEKQRELVKGAKGSAYDLMQVIDIDDIEVGNEYFGGKLKISIVELYSGVDFPNLGVSEVLVYMKEFPDPIGADLGEATGEGAINLIDGDKKSVWTSPIEGASFGFASDAWGLSSFTIQHGPKDHARVKTLRVSAAGRSFTQTIPDKSGEHRVQIPGVLGYNGVTSFEADEIKVEVLEVYPGSKEMVAISEVEFYASLASEF